MLACGPGLALTPLGPPGLCVHRRSRGHCPRALTLPSPGGWKPHPGKDHHRVQHHDSARARRAEGRSERTNRPRRGRTGGLPLCARRARHRAQPTLSPPPLGQASPAVSSPRGPQRAGREGPAHLHAYPRPGGGGPASWLVGQLRPLFRVTRGTLGTEWPLWQTAESSSLGSLPEDSPPCALGPSRRGPESEGFRGGRLQPPPRSEGPQAQRLEPFGLGFRDADAPQGDRSRCLESALPWRAPR